MRLMEDFKNVFRLEQVCNLFSSYVFIWIVWLQFHVFGKKGF